MRVLSKLAAPVVYLFEMSAGLVLKIFGASDDSDKVTEEEV